MYTRLITMLRFYLFSYVLKQRQMARRASYMLLKHKTNNYYMYHCSQNTNEKQTLRPHEQLNIT